jgi:methylated-DNA-[protein]-cysteine S-methyltransferase
MSNTYYYQAPCGLLEVKASHQGVTAIEWVSSKKNTPSSPPKNPHITLLFKEFDLYFAKKLSTFTAPLIINSGTAFQQSVWKALTNIAYGKTASYKDIAALVKSPKAVRAVGQANSKNPFCIVVPCHRIIQASGKLGGYAGGVEVKDYLLKLER